jgi:hypothetical protein
VPVQETFANVTSNLFGSKAAVFIAIVAFAALALGAEQILRVVDVGVPWRQLAMGRNLQTLTLSLRFSWVVVAARIRTALSG